MVMDCSIKLPFLHTSFLLFLSYFFNLNTVSSIELQLKYSQYCNSVVHQSKPADEEFNIFPFSERQNGYFSGGDNVLNRTGSHDFYYPPTSKTLVFETHHVYTTDVEDVFKVEGSLIFQTSYEYERSYSYDRIYHSSSSPSRGALDFDFQGFWSRKSGKLCMVGSAYTYSEEGKLLVLEAVLKFDNLKDLSTIHTLVTATMDSLHGADAPNYFDRISLLMFPRVSYKYTMVSNQFGQRCPGGTDVHEKSSLSLTRTRTICDMFSSRANVFKLEYSRSCDSSKNCNPFGDGIGYLPQFMSLSMIQCLKEKLQLRFLIEFPNSSYVAYYHSFNFSNSLVGEGSWDAKKNRLCFVACRIFDASNSLKKPSVGDCTTRLSLRFPAILSIKDTSNVIGEIWSEKPRNESGFFERIMFRNTARGRDGIQLQGLKYKYTETEKVKKLCPKKKPTSNSKGKYPDGYSTDMGMGFYISIFKGSHETIGTGSLDPLAVGNEPYQRFPSLKTSSSSRPIDLVKESDSSGTLLNISCKMSINLPSLKLDSNINRFDRSSNRYQDIQISAEGFYDAETGNLCMLGCRDVRSENKASLSNSMDCEILLNIQYPLNSDRRGKIRGSIKSMRQETEDLHFEPLSFSGSPYSRSWTEESIWRMDCEMIMSVISNTLAIIFVVLQIFHIRRHSGVSSFISVLMLVIQVLGHLTPLLLNLEAIFTQDSERSVLIRSGVWLEMKEVIIRVLTMVAFLLQIRLLMLSWTARCSNQNRKALWIAEKRGLYVCLPLYLVGAIIAFFVSRRHSSYSRYPGQILLGSSRAYAGLILDSFLFPQILFNMFHNSKQHALSPFYYIGITLVRVIPHGYDLYRASNFVDIDDSYIYADHAADYYSTAWDLIIPVLGLSFAAIIRKQQRLGGRCFLPKRFQESVIYEQPPMDGEDQVPLKSST